jgi:hypothetical protein
MRKPVALTGQKVCFQDKFSKLFKNPVSDSMVLVYFVYVQ